MSTYKNLKKYASKNDKKVKLITLDDFVNVIDMLKLNEALDYNNLFIINHRKYAHLH